MEHEQKIEKGSWKLTIPAGCVVEKDTAIVGGESGGPTGGGQGGGGILTVLTEIKNTSSEGDLVFEYSYERPYTPPEDDQED